jgi:phage baseplate assembly protein W
MPAAMRYTGPAYPFGADAHGVFGPKSDLAVVITSIANILSTPKGTVPHNPALGSWVPLLLFELNDEVTRSLIRHYTIKDLSEQEPRIVVRGVFTRSPTEHAVVVTVGFSLVGDPTGRVFNAPVQFSDTAF